LDSGDAGPDFLIGVASLAEYLSAVVKAIQCASRMTWRCRVGSGGHGSDARIVAYLRTDGSVPYAAPIAALLAIESFLTTARRGAPIVRELTHEDGDIPITFTKRGGGEPRPDPISSTPLGSSFEGGESPPPDSSRSDSAATRADVEATPWHRHRILGPERDHAACIVISGAWGNDLRPVIELVKYHQAELSHSVVISSPTVDFSLDRWALERSNCYIIGHVPECSHDLFEVASHLSMGRLMHPDNERACTLITGNGQHWQRMPVVLWG
jgi:hypothetical protein